MGEEGQSLLKSGVGKGVADEGCESGREVTGKILNEEAEVGRLEVGRSLTAAEGVEDAVDDSPRVQRIVRFQARVRGLQAFGFNDKVAGKRSEGAVVVRLKMRQIVRVQAR